MILLVFLSGVAAADIGRQQVAPAPQATSAQLTFAEQLEATRKLVLANGGDQKRDWVTHQSDGLPRQAPSGLPDSYYELLLAHRTNSSPGLRKEAEALGKASLDFDAVWTRVLSHQSEVDRAVAESQRIAAKDLPGARLLLSHVVSATPVDQDGRVITRTVVLGPEDVELPAIYALAEIAKQLHDRPLVIDVTLSLVGRRKVLVTKSGQLDKESERLVWLSAARNDAEHLLGDLHQGPAEPLFKALDAKADRILKKAEGIDLAREFFRAWPEYGIRVADLGSTKSAPVGACAVFPLLRTKLTKITVGADGSSLAYAYKMAWNESICGDTNQVVGVDPTTGRVKHGHDCDQVAKRETSSLQAKFRVKLPEYAQTVKTLLLLGRVVKSGGPSNATTWVVDDAELPGLSFMFDVAHEWWVWQDKY